MYPNRPLNQPILTDVGWVIDGRDLCLRPFSFTLPLTQLSGIEFKDLIAKGIDGCVYEGLYHGHSVAIKVGLSLDNEIEQIIKASILHISPHVLEIVTLTNVIYNNYNEKKGVEGGDRHEIHIIVMELYDHNMKEFCANPSLRTTYGEAVLAATKILLMETVPNALSMHEDMHFQNIMIRIAENGQIDVRLIDFVTSEFGSIKSDESYFIKDNIIKYNKNIMKIILIAITSGVIQEGPY